MTMTAGELREHLNQLAGHSPDRMNWQIYVVTSEGGVGGRSVVGFKGFAVGFDLDHGKIMLYPDRPLAPLKKRKKKVLCPDCGVSPGMKHKRGCDVERCPDCGGQMISCGCRNKKKHPAIVWAGEWPFLDACRQHGLWCKWVDGPDHGSWISCPQTDPKAKENLNALYSGFLYDPDTQTWRPK